MRTTILKIKTEDQQLIEVGILCNDLEKRSARGDTIEKIANENYVLLKKNKAV